MSGSGIILPSAEIERFVSALFGYADEGTFISLRAFDQKDRGKPPLLVRGVKVNGDLGVIVKAATRAADRADQATDPAVFAPPVCTFDNSRTARSSDVANGLVLSVELDAGTPAAALMRLEHLLGRATMTVASGGQWTDPETGEVHDKMHFHWRLSEPTRTAADHAKLQDARRLAALFVGGDPTAAPPAHPLRWPGSLNRKRSPRLATIRAENLDAEIHLPDALAALEEAVEAAGLGTLANGPRIPGQAQADLAVVASALAAVSNADLHWDEWNRIGMATWAATGGAGEGLDAWEAWSAKSGKHVPGACDARWTHYATSPPGRLGAGTILFMAQAEGWTRPGREPHRDEHLSDPGYRDSQAAEHQATPAPNTASAAEAPHKARGQEFGRLRLLSVADALDAKPRTYILDGLLAGGELSVWWGPPKSGKSFLMLRIAYGMSLGRGMWGREAEPLPVLYVAAEGESGVNGRIRALHDTIGDAPAFQFIAQSADLFNPDADLSSLIAAAKSCQARLLVVDTLARVMGAGDENRTPDMNAFVGNLDRLRAETGAHVAVVHHGGWEGAHARGSIALIGAADLVIKVSGSRETPHSALVEYNKDGPDGDLLGFKLDVFDLPPDAKGRPRNTCIAIETGEPAEPAKTPGKMNEEAATLLRDLHNAIASGHGTMARPLPDMPLVPTIQRSVLYPQLIQSGWLRLSNGLSKDEATTDSLGQVEQSRLWKRLNHLKLRGEIGFNRDCIWLAKKGLTA